MTATQEQIELVEARQKVWQIDLDERLSQIVYWSQPNEIVPIDESADYAYSGTRSLVRYARECAALDALLREREELRQELEVEEAHNSCIGDLVRQRDEAEAKLAEAQQELAQVHESKIAQRSRADMEADRLVEKLGKTKREVLGYQNALTAAVTDKAHLEAKVREAQREIERERAAHEETRRSRDAWQEEARRYEQNSALLRDIRDLLAPSRPASEPADCNRCGGTGEVAQGLPCDGPIPCPECAPAPPASVAEQALPRCRACGSVFDDHKEAVEHECRPSAPTPQTGEGR
jgi:hypothetical protein